MTVKKVNDELYDQRYAFMKYAQGKKSAIGDYSEPQAQVGAELATSSTHLQGLSQHLHGSIYPEDLRDGQSSKSRQRFMGPSSVGTSVKRIASNSRPSAGNSTAPQTRHGLADEDPGTLKVNQSQNKFWYKVRVKSSHGPRPKIMESFRKQLELLETETMKNPSAKLNQKSASFRALIEAEKKKAGEVALDEPSTQRPYPAKTALSSAPTRQFIHQVGTDERSIKQRVEEKSFSNIQVRYPATGRAVDFYNLNEATESETMKRRATVTV